MSDKQVHLVFQILNFITSHASAYSLTSDEKLLLIILARHKGQRGIYPTTGTLAKELERHRTNITRTIAKLEKKQLLIVDRKRGGVSHYTIVLPNSDLSTTCSARATGSVEATCSAHASTPVAPAHPTCSAGATQSDKRSNPLNNSERTRTNRAAPLSDDFLPNKDTAMKAKELGLTKEEAEEEFDKFRVHYKENKQEKTDWDLVLHGWFIRAASYKRRKKKSEAKDEIRSTIQFFDADPLRVLERERNPSLNGQGGHSHGLESRGTPKKDRNR